jgi:uncharacterized protein (TIGR03000 family)
MKRFAFLATGLLACGLLVSLTPAAFGQRTTLRPGAASRPTPLVNHGAAVPHTFNRFGFSQRMRHSPFFAHSRLPRNPFFANAFHRHHGGDFFWANPYAFYAASSPYASPIDSGGSGGYGGGSGGYDSGYGGSSGDYGSLMVPYNYQSPAGSIDPITPATYGGGASTASYYQSPFGTPENGSKQYGNYQVVIVGNNPPLNNPDYGSDQYGYRQTQGNYPAPAAHKQVASGNHAQVTVRVPTPYAELWFDGHKLDTSGTTREFQTPDLPHGQDVTYVVRAVWARRGQALSEERTVTVHAGQTALVDFTK